MKIYKTVTILFESDGSDIVFPELPVGKELGRTERDTLGVLIEISGSAVITRIETIQTQRL